jgi:hypothetical protein
MIRGKINDYPGDSTNCGGRPPGLSATAALSYRRYAERRGTRRLAMST